MSVLVDNVITKTHNYTQILRGSADPSVTSITINDAAGSVVLASGRWHAVVKLVGGTNEIKLQPYAGNKRLESVKLEIEVEESIGKVVSPNTLVDNWAKLSGLERRPNEKNSTFKNRILRFLRIRRDSSPRSLSRTINLALGLPEELNFLSLEITRDNEKRPTVTNAFCRTTGVAFELTCNEFITSEIHTVNPVDLGVSLAGKLCEFYNISPSVKDASGRSISTEDYYIDFVSNKIKFRKQKYEATDVKITFQYWHREVLGNHTLASLITAINSIQVQGRAAFALKSYTDNGNFSFNETAEKILPFPAGTTVRVKALIPQSILPRQDLVLIGIAKSKVLGLADNKLKYLNSRGVAINSRMAKWKKRLLTSSQLTWKYVKFDESLWQSKENPEAVDVIPHITNALGTLYKVNGVEYKFYELIAQGYNLSNFSLLTQVGVPENYWHSGVGTEGDLKPYIAEGRSISVEDLILANELAHSSGEVKLNRTTDISQLERINARA